MSSSLSSPPVVVIVEVDSLMLRETEGLGAGLTLALAARRGRDDTGVSGTTDADGTRLLDVAVERGADGRGVTPAATAGEAARWAVTVD